MLRHTVFLKDLVRHNNIITAIYYIPAVNHEICSTILYTQFDTCLRAISNISRPSVHFIEIVRTINIFKIIIL